MSDFYNALAAATVKFFRRRPNIPTLLPPLAIRYLFMEIMEIFYRKDMERANKRILELKPALMKWRTKFDRLSFDCYRKFFFSSDS